MKSQLVGGGSFSHHEKKIPATLNPLYVKHPQCIRVIGQEEILEFLNRAGGANELKMLE